MSRDPSDILDRKKGKVRVLSRRCTTCIFRRGNLMRLKHGRFEQIVEANVAAGALLTCHQTLPFAGNDFAPAACNGFWREHGERTAAGRLAVEIGIDFIDPPEKEE